MGDVWTKCRDLTASLLLPEGFLESVTSDYLEYSLWRGVQGVAAQISGVLATQSNLRCRFINVHAMLYAIGLGKGAIPTAAAVNWVLKDGIGYLSKIMLAKFGRHFDVNPKGWRLFADLMENAAFGMEILTPAFPHLFVPIGAFAGAGRSAGALIQAATRSCFYAGFAAQRNFVEGLTHFNKILEVANDIILSCGNLGIDLPPEKEGDIKREPFDSLTAFPPAIGALVSLKQLHLSSNKSARKTTLLLCFGEIGTRSMRFGYVILGFFSRFV